MNNQSAQTVAEINYDLLARFQVMSRGIIKTRDEMFAGSVNAVGSCDLRPHEVLSKKPRLEMFKSFFTYSNLVIDGRINIYAENESLMKQAGRALALSQSYQVIGNHRHVYDESDALGYPEIKSSNPVNIVKYGKVLRHLVTGQYIAAVMVVDQGSATPVDICEVYKFNHDTKKWTLHPVTILVRNGDGRGDIGAFQFNRNIGVMTPAYTKYNLLAAMLSGTKIHIVYKYEKGITLNQARWFNILVDTFRRELWNKVCGYGWRIEKTYAEMWDKVKLEIQKMMDSGEYTIDEIQDLL